MPTTFTTSFPVARGCTGTKRVVGSDPPKKMRFSHFRVQKSPREGMSVANCLSGSGGDRSLFINPSGKGFSHSEERWRGLDGQKRQCLDRDRHPGPRRARPRRRHSIAGSAPGPRQRPGGALPLSHTRVGIDFHWRDLLHFFFKKTHHSRPKNPAGGGKGNSQSEHEWARVRSLLKKGVSEETLVRQLEAQRQDKPKPAYYAQRTVTRAAASLREEHSTTPFNS